MFKNESWLTLTKIGNYSFVVNKELKKIIRLKVNWLNQKKKKKTKNVIKILFNKV